jgi:hypothetical protein
VQCMAVRRLYLDVGLCCWSWLLTHSHLSSDDWALGRPVHRMHAHICQLQCLFIEQWCSRQQIGNYTSAYVGTTANYTAFLTDWTVHHHLTDR